MKIRTIVATLACILYTTSLFSQTVITGQLQGFRPGDKLAKQQVKYKDPGRSGTDVIWDFSKLKSMDSNYSVSFYEPITKSKDTLFVTCVESQTMYKYAYKGDSMLFLGFENSGSQLLLDAPEYCMKFPFKMGDSISGTYAGRGRYEFALLTEIIGTIYTVADATGTLILPDGDTISNVLRVRTEHQFTQNTLPMFYEAEKSRPQKDSILIPNVEESYKVSADSSSSDASEFKQSSSVEGSKNENSKDQPLNARNKSKSTTREQMLKEKTDSLYFRTETCRWYAPGYRYPLFETVSNHGRVLPGDTVEIDDMSTAFYFPPSKHIYVEDDPENKAILDSIKAIVKEDLTPSDSLLFEYNYYPNPVRNDLEVELLLEKASKVTFRVFDSSGNVVLVDQEGNQPSGVRRFTLKTNKLRFGEYILHMEVDNQTAYALLLKI